MKKIFYSWVTKFIAMLCILMAVCVAVFEGIDIVKCIREDDAAYAEAYDEYMNFDTIFEEIYCEMGDDIDMLIAEYKEGGMDALVDYYIDSSMNMYVMATDSEYTLEYERLHKAEEGDYDYIEQALQEESVYYLYQYMHISDVIYLKESEYFRTASLGTYLSEESVEYLESIGYKLNISVRAKDAVFEIKLEEHLEAFECYAENRLGSTTLENEIHDRISIFVACGITVLLATIILAIICGREPDGKKELNYYERGYTELHLALMVSIGIALVCGVFGLLQCFNDMDWDIARNYKDALGYSGMGAILVGVLWLYYEMGIIVKKFINKRFMKDCLVVRLLLRVKRFLGKCMEKLKVIYDKTAYTTDSKVDKNYRLKVIADIIIAVVAVFMVSAPIEYDYDLGEKMLFFMVVIFIVYIIKSVWEYIVIRRYGRIRNAVDVIAEGNYKGIVTRENERDVTVQRLAGLSDSFEESVRKQVEAEKKQIELVANVSHDLKTPLTSIISYVDLLKEEEMSDVAKDYVTAIVDKSAKLKDIVSDVFDLAKATSGEKVELEHMDGVVLINQVLSDMSDRIEESGRDFRFKITTETAPIMGNGQKLYRVFQNVIDNALRYSLNGTRIYLTAESCNDVFTITLKNVSDREMDFTEEDILTRAQINDEMQTDDSKGLGIAIAKSFTQVCGGSFDIKLEDDIFKVIISFRQVYLENKGGVVQYEENNIQ